MTVNDLQFGEKGVIISLNMDEVMRHRMSGMGFIIGKTIEVLRRTKHTLHIKILCILKLVQQNMQSDTQMQQILE